MATPPALLAFVFVLVLMTVSPRRTPREWREWESDPVAVAPLPAGSWWREGIVVLFVLAYQRSLLGKYLNRNGSRCCFVPSCTEYSVLAARTFGLWRGLLLTGDRFRRCTPLYTGAYVDFPSVIVPQAIHVEENSHG